MMRYFLIFLFLSTPVLAQNGWEKTCIISTNTCFGIHTQGKAKTLYAPNEFINNSVGQEFREDFTGMGYKLAVLTPDVEQAIAIANAPVVTYSDENISHIFSDIPDEE
jgi:hypothetical protein